jgi:hypothetical protein
VRRARRKPCTTALLVSVKSKRSSSRMACGGTRWGYRLPCKPGSRVTRE